mmetsp:Transcript_8655/g.20929  ORF Transcript_8655/g.20929 Transcript_8655/m.20929 type:complete len:153 (+) Transcript_8655:87-545(+)|eukprot:CAMPEP_0178998424 /NCGR_PEP_ID=MMETSP0795-20121207/9504_1 /TAXON_ID=88552 /ORGANISM="Amoebophrya sp., Strain Ameob2" /LENGTH=152 /DNA_ID=CAMNT_0020691099 /DNA_START=75 /DNA_END=533 /DNA_ORIENTATION=-
MVRTTERSIGLCDPLYEPRAIKKHPFNPPRDELLVARKAQLAQKDWRANESEIPSAIGWPLTCTHEGNTPPNSELPPPKEPPFKRFARFDNNATNADVVSYRRRDGAVSMGQWQLKNVQRNQEMHRQVNYEGELAEQRTIELKASEASALHR